ncbi:MAG: MFS transporter [Promethearchaeota archaeon]
MVLLLVPALGNSVVLGSLAFLQFHAYLPVSEGGFGLSELEVGIVWGLVSLVGAASNVVWGAASDRTRTRWGRRRPYMVAFPPLTALFLWLTAAVDEVFGTTGIFWTLLLAFTAYKVAHAAASVPYGSLIPEVVPPERRVAASQASALMNGAGMVLGAVVPTVMFAAMESFAGPFVVLGVALVASYAMVAPRVVDACEGDPPPSTFAALKVTFADRNFMKFQVAQLLWSVGLNVVLFVIPFLAQELLGVQDEATYGALFISFLFIAGGFLYLFNWATSRRHVEKKGALQFSLAFTAAALPFMGLIGSPLFGGLPVLVQVYLLLSAGLGGMIGLMIYPYAIFMALIDRTRSSEATYNGVNAFVVGLATIPAGPLGGWVLSRFGFRWVGAFCALFVAAGALVFSRTRVPEHLFQPGGGAGGSPEPG